MVAECRYIIRVKTEGRGENTLSQRLVLAQKLMGMWKSPGI